jgi:hypothetical protein
LKNSALKPRGTTISKRGLTVHCRVPLSECRIGG